MRLRHAVVFAALCATAACSTAPPRFFTLPTLADAGAPPTSTRTARILGVGPITLPDYLRRPHLVTRVGDVEVRMADGARWSEPLSDALSRALATNLQLLVGCDRVVVYPWDPRYPPDRAVEIDVQRFEQLDDGTVELLARWWVRQAGSRTATLRETRVREPVAGDDPAASVDALGRALAQLSRDVAAVVVP